ncbi:MAG: secondary thiamine-phosphate synthase enzyme YjbQ [Pirellulales bacterium]
MSFWSQSQLTLPPLTRGFHLITDRVLRALPGLGKVRIGLLHLFLRHTSASLCINENADSDVPADLERMLNHLAPEDFPYRHTCEGPDDMPAHVKSALLGSSLTIPIRDGRLQLGTWQGIFLCEHRDRAAGRSLVLTVQGTTEVVE